MSLDDLFKIAVVIFTASNIGALSPETNQRETLKRLYSFRAIGLVLLWGWVVGPALAWLLNKGSAARGRARSRIASDQPGANRAVLPDDGTKGAGRHVIRQFIHDADHRRRCTVPAVPGAAVDRWPGVGCMGSGETAAGDTI